MKNPAEHIPWRIARSLGVAAIYVAATACTGTDSSLGVKSDPNDPNAAQFPDVAGVQPVTNNKVPIPSGVSEIGRVYFSPIVGAPIAKVGALSRRLGPASSANGVAIVGSADTSRTHEIKGYFSAFTEGRKTTVVHVWDIILPSGQRVHRIQGQVLIDGASEDPWSAVPDTTMAAIANSMVAEFAAWRASGA
jgi:hypothetical protein